MNREYRELEVGERIQEGDQWFFGVDNPKHPGGPWGSWKATDVLAIGSKYNPGSNPGQHSKHRRKIIMHYRNGREAKNGDKIVKLGIEGGKVEAFGVLHSAAPGNDYCNGNIAVVQPTNEVACMCDCLHVEDLAAILAEKGLDKRPSGK